MRLGLDTSVVVRIVSGLPEEDARLVNFRIASDISAGLEFIVSPLVLSEAYYALQHHYGFSKAEALLSLEAFVSTKGILADEWVKGIIALDNLGSAKPGFVDRMIVVDYAERGSGTYSCEKAFSRLPGTTVIP